MYLTGVSPLSIHGIWVIFTIESQNVCYNQPWFEMVYNFRALKRYSVSLIDTL